MGCVEARGVDVPQEVGPSDTHHIDTPIISLPRTEDSSVRALSHVLEVFERPLDSQRPISLLCFIGPSARWRFLREGYWSILTCKAWENGFRRLCRVADRRSQVSLRNGLPSSAFDRIRYRLNREHNWWRFTLLCVLAQYKDFRESVIGQGFECRRTPLTTALRLTPFSLSRQ